MEEVVYHVHDDVRQRLRARSQKDCHIPMVGWIKGHGNIQYNKITTTTTAAIDEWITTTSATNEWITTTTKTSR